MTNVDGNFWLDRWQKNEIGFHRAEPNYFLTKYFKSLNLPVNLNVLVPLCGKSLDMLWLAEEGCRVNGCELSNLACQQFYRENHIDFQLTEDTRFTLYQSEDISIFCGDFFEISIDDIGEVGFCYDRAALVALPRFLRKRYAQKISELLAAGANYLLEIKTYYCMGEIGPPFSIEAQEVVELFGNCFEIEFLETQPEIIRPDSNIRQHGATELINTAIRLTRK